MARKWLSFLYSLWGYIQTVLLGSRPSHVKRIRWVLTVWCGMMLAMSFQAIAPSQNVFLAHIQMDEERIAEELNRAGELSSLSLAHQQKGEWQAAEEAIEASLEILENLPVTDRREEIYGQTLDIWGQFYFARGKYDRALQRWENSAITYRHLNDIKRVRQSLLHQSRAFQALGNYDRACNALLESTGIQRRLEKFPGIARLNCIQFIQIEKALHYRGQETEREAKSEEKCDRFRQAIETNGISCQESEEIERALIFSRDRLSVIGEYRLGNVLRSLGELELSLKRLEESLRGAKALNLSGLATKINVSLGDTQRALGNRLRAYQESRDPPNFEFRFCRRNPGISNEYKAALDAYYQNYLQVKDDRSSSPSDETLQSYLNYLSLAVEFKRDGQTVEETMADRLGHDPNTIAIARSQLDALLTLSPKTYQQDRLAIEYARVLICWNNPNWDGLRNLLAKVAENARQRKDWRIESSALGYIGTLYEQEYWQTREQNKRFNNRFYSFQ